jgi:hypothetical protein
MSVRLPAPQWPAIALIFALLLTGHLTTYLPELIASPWTMIEDDGRHFVSWLRKLSDPNLFPDDPIEQFFRSVTPNVYVFLYAPAAWAGIDIVHWYVLMIIPIAMLLFLYAVDRFTAVFLSDPAQRAFVLIGSAAAFHSTYVLGLPRSFGPAITMLAIASFAAGQRWRLAVVMVIGANLYPSFAITAGAGLVAAEALRFWLERRADRGALMNLVIAALSGLAGVAVFLFSARDFGSAFSLAEARALPIFQETGRTPYFVGNTLFRMSCGFRAGVLPVCGPWFWWAGYIVTLGIIAIGLHLLPRQPHKPWRMLVGLCVAGAVLFILASAFAFKGHLPARYSQASIHLVFSFCLIAAIAIGVTAGVRRVGLRGIWAPAGLLVLLILLEFDDLREVRSMIRDPYPEISRTLRTLPTDTLVAGTARYTNNVPSFAARSVYAALELSVPYKRDYYRAMEMRAAVLAVLYGTTDVENWLAAHAGTGIDIYLVEDKGLQHHAWSQSFPSAPVPGIPTIFTSEAAATEVCIVAKQNELAMVDAECFVNQLSQS